MGNRSRPRAWTLLGALGAVLGCGGRSGPTTSVILDGAVDVPDVAAAPTHAGRCCALQVPDGSSAVNCTTLAAGTLGVSEPCLENHDGGGQYGLWTCGADASQTQCSDDGLSCDLGAPCTLVDVGCAGVVQDCGPQPDAGSRDGG
jgi:hypothetical protein